MRHIENHDILDLKGVEEEYNENLVLIDLQKRGLIFILDYSLLTGAIYLTYRFIGWFVESIPKEVTFILIVFYSILFVLREYKYDGSYFKQWFRIKNVSMDNTKLEFHIFLIKLILRPIAFLIAVIYIKLCFILFLWVFGLHKPIIRFLKGELFVLWYDYLIYQMTIKVNPDHLI